MVKRRKRFMAYIIDIFIIGVILVVLTKLLVDNKKIIILNQRLNEVNNTILESSVGFKESLKEYGEIVKQIDLENVMVNISTIIIILAMFIFLPYYNNGQTIGMKFLKTKIVAQDKSSLTISKLMLRNFIINGLLYLAISLTLLYLMPSFYYFILVSILGFFQLGLVIMSLFMLLYRKDQRGLQDILSETRIIEISGEENETVK